RDEAASLRRAGHRWEHIGLRREDVSGEVAALPLEADGTAPVGARIRRIKQSFRIVVRNRATKACVRLRPRGGRPGVVTARGPVELQLDRVSAGSDLRPTEGEERV